MTNNNYNNWIKSFEIKDLSQIDLDQVGLDQIDPVKTQKQNQIQTQIKTLQKYHKLIAHLPTQLSPPRSEKSYRKSHTVGTPRLITGKVRRAKKI